MDVHKVMRSACLMATSEERAKLISEKFDYPITKEEAAELCASYDVSPWGVEWELLQMLTNSIDSMAEYLEEAAGGASIFKESFRRVVEVTCGTDSDRPTLRIRQLEVEGQFPIPTGVDEMFGDVIGKIHPR